MIDIIVEYLRDLALAPWPEGQDLREIAARSYEQAVQYGVCRCGGFLGWSYLYYKTHGAFAEYPAIKAGLQENRAQGRRVEEYIDDLLARTCDRLRQAEGV